MNLTAIAAAGVVRQCGYVGLLLVWLAAFFAAGAARAEDDVLRVGSKRFTEAYILAEILAQTAAPHARTQVRQGLGNTAIVFEALRSGNIDLYPDYLGTIDLEILQKSRSRRRWRRSAPGSPDGGSASAAPLGFNNGYALAMRADEAKRLGIAKLSDLAAHPQLKIGLSNEFIGRADGWPGLSAAYGLPHRPTAVDHGIAYDALGGRTGGRDRHLHHRRQDRVARPGHAGRRPQLLPEVRRGAALPARRAAALSAGVAGDRAARRPHRRAEDDRDERTRRT